jgi:hypothetical protein
MHKYWDLQEGILESSALTTRPSSRLGGRLMRWRDGNYSALYGDTARALHLPRAGDSWKQPVDVSPQPYLLS